MNKPQGDLEKVLEKVAREMQGKPSPVESERAFYEAEIEAKTNMLKRRLLPLLQAGQAMRNSYANNENWREAWDAALKAILEA